MQTIAVSTQPDVQMVFGSSVSVGYDTPSVARAVWSYPERVNPNQAIPLLNALITHVAYS